jgi:hypothetical protein
MTLYFSKKLLALFVGVFVFLFVVVFMIGLELGKQAVTSEAEGILSDNVIVEGKTDPKKLGVKALEQKLKNK